MVIWHATPAPLVSAGMQPPTANRTTASSPRSTIASEHQESRIGRIFEALQVTASATFNEPQKTIFVDTRDLNLL